MSHGEFELHGLSKGKLLQFVMCTLLTNCLCVAKSVCTPILNSILRSYGVMEASTVNKLTSPLPVLF